MAIVGTKGKILRSYGSLSTFVSDNWMFVYLAYLPYFEKKKLKQAYEIVLLSVCVFSLTTFEGLN
jgi:hypothetical protein